MRRAGTTSRSPLPPHTREVPLDEEWAFVAKEGANRDPSDPADARKGDHRDHGALGAEHRPVVSAVPGERTAENTGALVRDFRRPTAGRLMRPITTDG